MRMEMRNKKTPHKAGDTVWHTRMREDGRRQQGQKWSQETRAKIRKKKAKERKRETKGLGGTGREHGA